MRNKKQQQAKSPFKINVVFLFKTNHWRFLIQFNGFYTVIFMAQLWQKTQFAFLFKKMK